MRTEVTFSFVLLQPFPASCNICHLYCDYLSFPYYTDGLKSLQQSTMAHNSCPIYMEGEWAVSGDGKQNVENCHQNAGLSTLLDKVTGTDISQQEKPKRLALLGSVG